MQVFAQGAWNTSWLPVCVWCVCEHTFGNFKKIIHPNVRFLSNKLWGENWNPGALPKSSSLFSNNAGCDHRNQNAITILSKRVALFLLENKTTISFSLLLCLLNPQLKKKKCPVNFATVFQPPLVPSWLVPGWKAVKEQEVHRRLLTNFLSHPLHICTGDDRKS